MIEKQIKHLGFYCTRCGKCCQDTEMEINNTEILKLEKLGYYKKEFVRINNDGFKKLKNINGHCYFFDPNNRKCIIYEERPLGCIFYPVILHYNKCEIDVYCSCYEENKKIEIPLEICNRIKKYIKILDNEIRESIS